MTQCTLLKPVPMRTFALLLLTGLLSACAAARTTANVVTLPVKAAYYTGKGVYLTGKGIYKVGEGVYRVGQVPVRITHAALHTTSDVLLLTTRVMTTAGTIADTTRRIETASLSAELLALKSARNVVEVIVDVPGLS